VITTKITIMLACLVFADKHYGNSRGFVGTEKSQAFLWSLTHQPYSVNQFRGKKKDRMHNLFCSKLSSFLYVFCCMLHS
jgi:hypothetical protein